MEELISEIRTLEQEKDIVIINHTNESNYDTYLTLSGDVIAKSYDLSLTHWQPPKYYDWTILASDIIKISSDKYSLYALDINGVLWIYEGYFVQTKRELLRNVKHFDIFVDDTDEPYMDTYIAWSDLEGNVYMSLAETPNKCKKIDIPEIVWFRLKFSTVGYNVCLSFTDVGGVLRQMRFDTMECNIIPTKNKCLLNTIKRYLDCDGYYRSIKDDSVIMEDVKHVKYPIVITNDDIMYEVDDYSPITELGLRHSLFENEIPLNKFGKSARNC
jgi:hypothetical protein